MPRNGTNPSPIMIAPKTTVIAIQFSGASVNSRQPPDHHRAPRPALTAQPSRGGIVPVPGAGGVGVRLSMAAVASDPEIGLRYHAPRATTLQCIDLDCGAASAASRATSSGGASPRRNNCVTAAVLPACV